MKNDMHKIIIFSGTTEGRELSEALSARGIDHTVCVATEYGQLLQPEGAHVEVQEGRKDFEAIRDLIEGAEVVVDATHPYATAVSDNIKRAADAASVRRLRVLRDCGERESVDLDGVTLCDSPEDCAGALGATEGNILFTTGSKELGALCANIPDMERVYVRVLPSEESLKLCTEAGVRSDHIIALQGPFSEELNLALIRQFDIAALVTKDSGRAGGFKEKIDAARKAGIRVLCIKRPIEEGGISSEEALYEIEKLSCKTSSDIVLFPQAPNVPITISVIGMGMGNKAGLTREAEKAMEEADLIFGAERLIQGLPDHKAYPYYLAADIIPEIARHLSEDAAKEKSQGAGEPYKVAVLFSGDIGFYSGARKFEDALRAWHGNISFAGYPGISSVSYLAARIGVSYCDAELLSFHGRNGEAEIAQAIDKIRHSQKTFILLTSGDDIERLRAGLLEAGVTARITVGRDLSYDNEIIREYLPEEKCDLAGKGLFTLFAENPEPRRRLLVPAFEDEDFIRNKTPMTKAVIRHECVRLLGIRDGDVLYDVGSGTGSVAIEAAGLSGSLRVYSFEKKADAVEVQRQNLEKFRCRNITLFEGVAPEVLSKAPEAPDAVFIGGSGGNLSAILTALKGYKKPIRVVITAITLETISEILKLKKDPEVRSLEILQITAGRAETVGDYSLMKTENTVTIGAFDLGTNQ